MNVSPVPTKAIDADGPKRSNSPETTSLGARPRPQPAHWLRDPLIAVGPVKHRLHRSGLSHLSPIRRVLRDPGRVKPSQTAWAFVLVVADRRRYPRDFAYIDDNLNRCVSPVAAPVADATRSPEPGRKFNSRLALVQRHPGDLLMVTNGHQRRGARAGRLPRQRRPTPSRAHRRCLPRQLRLPARRPPWLHRIGERARRREGLFGNGGREAVHPPLRRHRAPKVVLEGPPPPGLFGRSWHAELSRPPHPKRRGERRGKVPAQPRRLPGHR